MKKIFACALALCLALLMAVPAFADGRGPAFSSYDVVCTKDTPYYEENWDKDGVMEKKGAFPKGKTLTISYELDRDGVLYGNVEIDASDGYEWVYVRLSDVEVKDNTYLPKNREKLSQPQSVRVIAKGGVPLYAGPNEKFEQIATVPRGTRLTFEYANDPDEAFRTWAYVTYLGRSGWLYVHSIDTKNGVADLPDEDDTAEIWVYGDDVKLYDGMSFGNIEDMYMEQWDEQILREKHEEPDRVIATLEKGKKYTYRYSHGFGLYDYPDGTWYYVTAGLRSGWVYAGRTGCGVAVPSQDGDEITFKPVTLKLYETPDKKAAAVTVDLDKNTVLEPEFEMYAPDDLYYYATVGGQSGWYTSESIDDANAYAVPEDYMDRGYVSKNDSGTDAPIYKDILKKDETVGTIPAGASFVPLFSGGYESNEQTPEDSLWKSIYYVDYDGVTGWVMEYDVEARYTPESETDDPEAESAEIPDDEEPEEETAEAWDDAEEEDAAWEEETVAAADAEALRSYPPMRYILPCVAAAVILALTAVVTLTLIRRKRSGKGAEPDTIEAETSAVETPSETEDETTE